MNPVWLPPVVLVPVWIAVDYEYDEYVEYFDAKVAAAVERRATNAMRKRRARHTRRLFRSRDPIVPRDEVASIVGRFGAIGTVK